MTAKILIAYGLALAIASVLLVALWHATRERRALAHARRKYRRARRARWTRPADTASAIFVTEDARPARRDAVQTPEP